MQVSSVLGPICTALSIGFIWPQVVRVYRLRSVEGISPKGTLHSIAGTCLWTVYGFAKFNMPLSVANIVVGSAMILIAAAQIRHRVLSLVQYLGVIALFTSIGLAAAIGVSPALCGWLATVVSATSIIPQAVHVLRATDLSGLSLAMYSLLVVTGVAWSAYGVLVNDIVLAAPNLIMVPCSAMVSVKIWRFQRAVRSAAAGSVAGDLAVVS